MLTWCGSKLFGRIYFSRLYGNKICCWYMLRGIIIIKAAAVGANFIPLNAQLSQCDGAASLNTLLYCRPIIIRPKNYYFPHIAIFNGLILRGGPTPLNNNFIAKIILGRRLLCACVYVGQRVLYERGALLRERYRKVVWMTLFEKLI